MRNQPKRPRAQRSLPPPKPRRAPAAIAVPPPDTPPPRRWRWPKLPPLPALPEPLRTLPEPLRSYGPVFVALLYMLPRVWNAHFGLLDDGVTLSAAKLVAQNPSYSLHAYEGAGRFLPGYWLYWTFWYVLAGMRPALFFAGQAGLLALAVWAMIRLLRQWEAGAMALWTCGLFFIFSAPAAEAYFTLSKGEPVALDCCLGSILAAHRAQFSARPAPWWTLAGAFVLAAVSLRETAIAFVGVVGFWWLLSFWRGFGKPLWLSRRSLAIYLAAALAGAAPLFAGRFLMRQSLAAGSYASQYRLTWSNLSQSARIWSYSLERNFPALVVLAICAALLFWRRILGVRPAQFLMMMAAWMAASAAILMPWPQTFPYYQLAFAAGAAMFSGLMVGKLIRLAGERRRWAGAALVIVALLGLMTAVSNANFARCQILVDAENAALLEALRKLPPRSVAALNLPAQHEYAVEIELHLKNLMGRQDLQIVPLDFAAAAGGGRELPGYAVSIDIVNQRRPLLRGPMPEVTAGEWRRTWEDWSSGLRRAAPRQTIRRTWQMVDIGLEIPWCRWLGGVHSSQAPLVCQPRPFLDLRKASYGWTIDAYPSRQEPVRAAAFDAGVWTIEQAAGPPLKLPPGLPGDVPVAADWDGDGRLDPGVYRPSTKQWLIGGAGFSLPGMNDGDVPVAGDWMGARRAAPGFYRPPDHTWHLFRSPAGEALPVIQFGALGGIPLTGDWTGSGRSSLGIYHPGSGYVTLRGSLAESSPTLEYSVTRGSPVVVNWSGVGVDTVNTVNTAQDGVWFRQMANCQCVPANPPAAFTSRLSEGRMFAGRWKTPAAK